mmetsp:Transcript_23643/g.70349  ORF Transcript_23643/g.70349 Transcript_23643/m.70349 type:complete len:288 (+) Transcript_23643:2302-3165(+)
MVEVQRLLGLPHPLPVDQHVPVHLEVVQAEAHLPLRVELPRVGGQVDVQAEGRQKLQGAQVGGQPQRGPVGREVDSRVVHARLAKHQHPRQGERDVRSHPVGEDPLSERHVEDLQVPAREDGELRADQVLDHQHGRPGAPVQGRHKRPGLRQRLHRHQQLLNAVLRHGEGAAAIDVHHLPEHLADRLLHELAHEHAQRRGGQAVGEEHGLGGALEGRVAHIKLQSALRQRWPSQGQWQLWRTKRRVPGIHPHREREARVDHRQVHQDRPVVVAGQGAGHPQAFDADA